MVAINVEDLTNEEQLGLIELLWESLRLRAERDPSTLSVSEAQEQELAKRLDAFQSGEMAGKPLLEAFDSIRSRRRNS